MVPYSPCLLLDADVIVTVDHRFAMFAVLCCNITGGYIIVNVVNNILTCVRQFVLKVYVFCSSNCIHSSLSVRPVLGRR